MRALTLHTCHRHDAPGTAKNVQRRQLDIWIDLEIGKERRGKVSKAAAAKNAKKKNNAKPIRAVNRRKPEREAKSPKATRYELKR